MDLGVALDKSDVADTGRIGGESGLDEHGHRQVDTDPVTRRRRPCRGERGCTAPAADIEHLIVGVDRGLLEEHGREGLQHSFVGDLMANPVASLLAAPKLGLITVSDGHLAPRW